jgi:RNA polymerase sigma-70 factor, ECF subfamily
VGEELVLDPDAWEALYRRAHPALLGYAVRRLGDRDAAEDAVSETMSRAVAAVDRYRPEGLGVEAWLVGILRNVVHEAWRRERRSVRDAGVPLPVGEAGVDARLLGDEEARAVRKAFASLEPSDQEVLELRVVLGMSADDVAAVQGRNPGAVRMAQHRAVGRLRAIMGHLGHG